MDRDEDIEDAIHELDSGLTEDEEDRSLDRRQEGDREATRKRRSVLRSVSLVTWSFILLIVVQFTLNIYLRYDQESPQIVGRDHLMVTLGVLAQRGWLYFNHSLYFVSTTKRNWPASRDDCLQRNAHLVVINSIDEQEFVSKLNSPHWIGLSDRDTEGTWKWVDGTSMTSSFWGPGEPGDKDGEEDCVVEGLTGDWSDTRCDRRHYWICEKAVVLDFLEDELNKEEMFREEVEVPTITELLASTMRLDAGDTARFSCCASGVPEPTVKWLLDGRPLNGTDDQSEPAVRVEGRNLVVRGVRSGGYTVCCRATNSAGTDNRTAKLNVYDACGFTLDPNTAYRELSVSKDEKTVTRVEDQPHPPHHPDRFTTWPQVLSRESLTDRCYWEVEKRGWVGIAVAYRGIPRGARDDNWFGGNTKSLSLVCLDDRYVAMYNGSRTVIDLPPSGSNRVRVYVDRPAGTVSYYRVTPDVGGSADPLSHIITINITFTQDEFLLGFEVGHGSSVSLRQSPARV